MSDNFTSGNCFPNPIALGDKKFFSQQHRNLNSNPCVTLPYQHYQLRERLPELLQQLHSLKPLCCSGNQRELARKALTALKKRAKEDIRHLAKSVADDVADAID
jgi:hypothetical protein